MHDGCACDQEACEAGSWCGARVLHLSHGGAHHLSWEGLARLHLIEFASAHARPGRPGPGQGGSQARPGSQSCGFVYTKQQFPQITELRGRKNSKSTGAKKFNKMTGPIPARHGSGRLRSGSARQRPPRLLLGWAEPGPGQLGSARLVLGRLGSVSGGSGSARLHPTLATQIYSAPYGEYGLMADSTSPQLHVP